ncbi:class I SAM-dependent methyltransferase [Actinokineospora sp. NPDC004072]
MTIYDAIGRSYTSTRRPDPRIGALIAEAVGGARRVINVGAGAGAYEPVGTVLAVEPSLTMVRQRPVGAAPVVRGVAEGLPVRDQAADVVLAVLTVHHWGDLEAGVAELRRVARRVVVLTWDQEVTREFWLLRDYLPEVAAFDDRRAVPLPRLVDALGARVVPVPVPHDCTDGFLAAYWRRPAAYLDPAVRAGASGLAQTGEERLRPGLARLAADMGSGAWLERYGELMDMAELDAGYRLLVADT